MSLSASHQTQMQILVVAEISNIPNRSPSMLIVLMVPDHEFLISVVSREKTVTPCFFFFPERLFY